MPNGRRPVAEVLCDDRAHIYEHGWQSRSPAGRFPVTSRAPLGSAQRTGGPVGIGGFRGAGLLAVELEPGGPARLWAAPRPAVEVPTITAEPLADSGGRVRLLISADGDVVELAGTSLATVVQSWARQLAATAGVAATPATGPVWCSRCALGPDAGADGTLATDLAGELAAMDRLDLGVEVLVLDQGARHDAGIGDWEPATAGPRDARVPLAALAGRVRDAGRRVGVRLAPFLVAAGSRLAETHPDWLVGGADAGMAGGRPLHVLDVTHPDAAAHLRELVAALVDAGVDHLVLDELWAGALGGRRHADSSPLAAYREGLRLVREAAGPGPTLVGAAAPLLPSVGLVDAMRTGPDVLEGVSGLAGVPDATLAEVMTTTAARAWQHGRFWVAAPGCLLAGPRAGARAAWAGHLAELGGLASSGDRLAGLDHAGAELTRRVLRPSSPGPVPWVPATAEPDVIALLA